jgi:hypothetical protein
VIEHCLLVPAIDQLPDQQVLSRFSRIYLGNEYCEWRMPTPRDVDACLEMRLPVTLLTPLVTGVGIRAVQAILDRLADRGDGSEVVANDFGVLAMLQGRTGLTAIAGRLLTRNFIDIFDNALTFTSVGAFEFMADRYRVSRYEVSSFRSRLRPGLVPSIASRINLTMHFPYQHVATTRQCLFRFRDVPTDERIDLAGCDQACRGRTFRLEYPGKVKEAFFVRGNTMFVSFDEVRYSDEELERLRVDRTVESLEPPV